MQLTLILLSAYFLGFFAAIPVGPVQIEVVRRSIHGHIKPSFMVVLGAFLADAFYGFVALFGVAPFLEKEKVMAVFWLSGGVILTIVGAITIAHSLKAGDITCVPDHLKKKRWAFLGGLSLSATNPMMILWWLSGVKIVKDIGLIATLDSETAFLFLVTGSIGIASYLGGLSLFIFWAKKFISPRTLKRMNISFGMFLMGIAAYFILSSLFVLLRTS